MITFERTKDRDLIREVVTHPRVYRYVSDDYSPLPEEWEPSNIDIAWYVVVRDNGEILGMWIMSPVNKACWEVHTCLLPCSYGDRAYEASKLFSAWFWKEVPSCIRIVTQVPSYNRLALNFAQQAGMSQYGVNFKAYVKDGKIHDIFLLGLSKQGV